MHPFYRQANRGSVVFDELAKPLVHVCRQSSHGRGKTPPMVFRTMGSSPRLIRASLSPLGLSVVVRNQEGWVTAPGRSASRTRYGSPLPFSGLSLSL